MIRNAMPMLLLPLALAACSVPLQGRGPEPSAEAVSACNTRADEMFTRQHRDAIYKADTYTSSVRDSPYGGGTLTGTNAGLSDQYDRNEDVRTCLNGVATPIEPEPAATAAP